MSRLRFLCERNRVAGFLGILAALLSVTRQAESGTIAYSNNVVSSGIQNWNGNLGLDFIVNQAVSVSRLGAFDNGVKANLNGANGSSGVTVGIFSSSGIAVAPPVTLTASSTGTQVNGDFFVDVTPFTLLPGAYSVVTFNSPNYNSGFTNTAEAVLNNGGGLLTLDPGLNVRWDSGSGFGFPTANVGVYGPDPRFGAGTFAFDAAIVPPPPTINGEIAYDNQVVSESGLQNWQGNLGLDFTVNQSVVVESLGVFNNGIAANLWGVDGRSGIMVGIYDKIANTLVSPAQVVTPDSIGKQINADFFVPVTPFTLAPGQYSIVTFNDKNYNSGFTNTAGAILHDGSGALTLSPGQTIRWDSQSSFGLPTANIGIYGPDPRFGSGTFTFVTSVSSQSIAAPEPSSLTVMLGLIALVGFVPSARRKLTASEVA